MSPLMPMVPAWKPENQGCLCQLLMHVQEPVLAATAGMEVPNIALARLPAPPVPAVVDAVVAEVAAVVVAPAATQLAENKRCALGGHDVIACCGARLLHEIEHGTQHHLGSAKGGVCSLCSMPGRRIKKPASADYRSLPDFLAPLAHKECMDRMWLTVNMQDLSC